MIKKLLFKSDFIKYLLVLMSGAVVAQMLGYVFAPIITRIYDDPAQLAELGIFIRIVGVGAAFSTARYELTLPIVKNNVHSFRLYHIALRITVITTLLSLLILLYPVFSGEDGVSYIFYALVPIAIFLTASMSMGTHWAIRMKLFKSITYSKITNSIVGNGTKVLLGLANLGYIGLIIGTVLGLLFANVWFVRDFFSSQKEYKIKSSSPRNFVLAKEHIEFPKINLPHVLLDLGKDLMVFALILHFYDKANLGLYDHSYRMLRLPLILVGVAIGQVFFQKCSDMFNKKEEIYPLIRKSVISLALLSIVPFTVIFFFGSDMFAYVFGEPYRMAGVYSEIMAPWFMMVFIASPVSFLPLIIKRQKEFFILAIFASLLMVAAVSIPPYFYNASIQETLWILSLSQAAYIVLTIFKYFQYSKKADAR